MFVVKLPEAETCHTRDTDDWCARWRRLIKYIYLLAVFVERTSFLDLDISTRASHLRLSTTNQLTTASPTTRLFSLIKITIFYDETQLMQTRKVVVWKLTDVTPPSPTLPGKYLITSRKKHNYTTYMFRLFYFESDIISSNICFTLCCSFFKLSITWYPRTCNVHHVTYIYCNKYWWWPGDWQRCCSRHLPIMTLQCCLSNIVVAEIKLCN